MNYIKREIEQKLIQTLARNKSVLLLGARQTGKTTLVNHIGADRTISFINPLIRQDYERNPAKLIAEIEALADSLTYLPTVLIDGVQKVPLIMDVAQDLIDRKIAKFILTGSSARKLKKPGETNLLPGRVIPLHLDPLTLTEIDYEHTAIKDLLLYGSLPDIYLNQETLLKDEDLASYVAIYLEEEIRSEALVRNIASFSEFLSIAATESGKLVNFSKLSQSIGVAHTTIASYYQILEDCLIAIRIEPLTKNKGRRRLVKSPKYLFFDLGVRRAAAGEGLNLPQEYLGHLFEQFVGLELMRLSRFISHRIKIKFWHDNNGPEVDWVIETHEHLIPIEVKWTTNPSLKHAKHLQLFIQEYSNAEHAYIVCRAEYRIKLADNITAIPWRELPSLFTTND